jgi:type II secretory pathway pseudopilin PulG
MKTDGPTTPRVDGYAMAALLVALAVMAVAMTVAMPTWRHMVRREKEEELVFRGQQYARAVGLFQRKFAGAYAPDIDTLLKQKCLRKKYKDPMVEDGEFEVLRVGQQMPGTGTGGAGQPAQGGQGSRGGQTPASSFGPVAGDSPQAGPRAGPTGGPRGGIIGVRSRSTEASIRIYKGGTHYNEWAFVWAAQQALPGGPRGGRPGSGQGMPPSTPATGQPGAQPPTNPSSETVR